jgi:D-amino-acid oxidase
MKKGEILIIGAGVSGLTCGIRLLEDGFPVRIIAQSVPPDTTSNVAPAYWYPYRVSPQDKVLKWAAFSYRKFLQLCSESGITMFELLKLYDREIEIPFWKEAVRAFRRAEKEELPEGYKDGFVAEVPRIETPIYMRYLTDTYNRLGGSIEKLDKDIDSLHDATGEELIINCAGLGAGKLCGDDNVFPIRGQVVRTENPGLTRCVSDESGPLAVSYIVPRSGDCVLGGTAEENNWSLEVDPATSENIVRKCAILEPRLKGVRVLEHRVGLRPGRTEVRLEIEHLPDKSAVIHNYGHGGGGYTLSWGCAEDVLELARDFVAGR